MEDQCEIIAARKRKKIIQEVYFLIRAFEECSIVNIE
jgi:hypothetical protein